MLGRSRLLKASIRCFSDHLTNTPSSSSHPKVVLAGIQPTGSPHLGNYFGFIEPWLDIQKNEASDVPLYLSIVDQHAISMGPIIPAEKLRLNTRKMAASLIACGIDPKRTTLFRQSDVPEISQMNWILGSLQTLAQLQRLPQFKDKSTKFSRGSIPIGLLIYPLLQAADVFTFKGTHVPVGEDQSQHMNLMNNLAFAFNSTYKLEFFPLPKQITRQAHARIRSLRDPRQKMSKSDPSVRGRIDVDDSEAVVMEKCRKAMSDTITTVSYDKSNRPAISNMIEILAATTRRSLDETISLSSTWTHTELKDNLTTAINRLLGPIRERLNYYEQRPQELEEILAENGVRARMAAKKVLLETRELVGLC
ncbi:unnamed protein product, partial [Mesorhabditis belari]|uniref:tryptophan--tRNA ligase n=1 Tax=Mesorhabditis belari TaxID=2138241 RepID=A0AAF3J206_9BILA